MRDKASSYCHHFVFILALPPGVWLAILLFICGTEMDEKKVSCEQITVLSSCELIFALIPAC